MKTPILPVVLAAVLLSAMSLPAAAAEGPRTDAEGFPLPEGVRARIGSARFRHPDGVERICWSHDGKQVAASGSHGPGSGICVWDFATGKTVRWSPQADPEDWVRALSFSADGRRLLAVLRSRQDNAVLGVLDPATGAVIKRPLGIKAGIDIEWAFSRGGRWLAAAGNKEIRLFDTNTAREPRRFDAPQPSSLAIDDSGRWLVLSSEKGVLVLDAQTGKRTSPAGKESYGQVAVAYRKGLFAALNRAEDQWTIDVLSLEDGSRRHRFSFAGEEPNPTHLSFSPDDRAILVRCEESRALALYDLEARKWAWQVSTFPHEPGRAAFSPDGKIVALAGPGTAPVFLDAATGKLDPHTPDLFDDPRPLAFAGRRRVLVADGGFEVRDAATGRLVRKLPSVPLKKRFVPWEWGTSPSPGESYGWYWHGCCAHDGRQVFAFAAGHGYRADGRTGEALPCPDVPVAKWSRVVCSADGAHLVFAGYQKDRGGTVQVWDVARGARRHTLFDAEEEEHYHLIPGDDPRLLLSSIDTRIRIKRTPPDATVRLWDIVTGRQVASFRPQGRPFRYAASALSPDGGTVAAPSWVDSREAKQALVQFWEVKTARPWLTVSMDLLKQRPRSIALAPGGGRAAIGCEDGRLLLWEVASGKVRGTFRHESKVEAVRFSPDGRLLAAASAEAPIYLWDIYGTPEASSQHPPAALWEDLKSDDAARAFAAMRQLIHSPSEAVEVLKGKLKPLPADETDLQRLVADLDSTDFEARQRATAALQKLDERADAFLRGARKKASSQEAQRRLDQVLRRPIRVGPEALRALRAVEVLEAIGGPEAAAALESLAAGPAEDRLTAAAKEARARIQGRKKM